MLSRPHRRVAAGAVEEAPYRSGDLVAGRYEVKEVVGGGPLGFVFRCRDKELEVEVALKVIHPRLLQTGDERKAFFNVIRQARRLSHQNLARVIEEGEDRGGPFFVTQYLEGMSLRKIIDLRLARGQTFTLSEAEPILGQIARALASAHQQGPHANLKPENVIVLPDLLKVTDFGLGVALPRAPFLQAQRSRRMDHYCAPELIADARPSVRMDVYSLGMILGELLTGLATEGTQVLSLRRYRPNLPQEVDVLYCRAVERAPQARIATPAELFAELATIVQRDVMVTSSSMAPTMGAQPPAPRVTQPIPVVLPEPTPASSPDSTEPLDASLLPTSPAHPLPAAGGEETAPVTSRRLRSIKALWLVLLVGAGFTIGVLVGSLVLDRARRQGARGSGRAGAGFTPREDRSLVDGRRQDGGHGGVQGDDWLE